MRGSRTATIALRRWCNSLASPSLQTERALAGVSSSSGDVREGDQINSSTTFSVSQRFAPVGGFSSSFFRLHSVAAAVAEEGGLDAGSPEVERVYKELNESIRQKRMPEASLLPSLLQNCGSPADVKLAFDVVDRLRRLKAVQGQQKTNYNKHMAQLMAEACIRSGDAQAALPTLMKRNVYGFTPSLDQAHLLLKHALGQKDTKLMLKVLRTMVASEVFPTPVSAELILRTCKDAGNTELLIQLAKEMRVNGVSLKKPLYDMLIATAANVGDVKAVHEVQEWREEHGMAQTTASAFALAKALVLDGKCEEAAKMIVDHCTDAEKRGIYLQIMVKVWPLQVGAKVEEGEKESFLEDLKKKVVAMSESLVQSGCNVPVDVNEDFAKGSGSKSKAEDEVWTASASS
ncbi:hypothetical protein M758_2G083400 [Ceratodon purpureus]|nr:hypothetical protein M758_2G083400 [Ceratodon purpureus]